MLSFGDSRADQACRLECVEHLPPVHEFVGPVKIVLMDVPKSVYMKRKWISALIAFAEMLIGANVLTVLFYTLCFKTPLMMNIHIVLCTIGFQFFMPAAILMHSNFHGPSTTLKVPDRRFQHMILQIFALTFAGAGGALVMFLGPGSFPTKFKSIHCWAGLVASVIGILAPVKGLAAYCFNPERCFGRFTRILHAMLGVSAFLASSICFCLGIFYSESFKSWVPLKDMPYIVIIFCGMYTAIVVCSPIMRMASKKL